jgi:hypothetical protein
MYGNADGDGLPNWFEMYWFGKFQDWSTCTGADPAADPDRDGLTNQQEYLAQSDPTVPAPVYKVGDVWDLSTVHQRKTSFNPDPDFHDTPVWHYLYRIGKPPIPADGAYKPCPRSIQKTPYTGPMSHHSPYRADGFSNVHGWFDRAKAADGTLRLRARPRREVNLALAWESPIDGIVAFAAEIAAEGNNGAGTVTIQQSKSLAELGTYTIRPGHSQQVKLDDIEVRRGQQLYMVFAAPRDQPSFRLEHLSITVTGL